LANPNAPFGARLIDADGKTVRVRRYVKKTGSAIYPGDFVKYASTGNVEVAIAADVLLGVALEYKAATDVTEIAVCDDPDAIFAIQADGNTVAADVFQNCDFVATAGDTGKLQSKMALDSSEIATTNTLPLKILGLMSGFTSAGANSYGSYAVVKVRINQHAFSSGVSGI
jgi:hypothetical protein